MNEPTTEQEVVVVARKRKAPGESPGKRFDLIKDMIENKHMTIEEIGKHFGVTKQRIQQVCEKNDYSVREIKKKFSEKKKEEKERIEKPIKKKNKIAREQKIMKEVESISKDWKSGMSIERLMKKYGYTIRTSFYMRMRILRKKYKLDMFPYRRNRANEDIPAEAISETENPIETPAST